MSSQYFWAFGVLPFVVFLPSSSAETRTGVFRDQTITYELVDGRAVFEGDILLGTPDVSSLKTNIKDATAVPGDNYRWPDGVLPPVAWSQMERVTGRPGELNERLLDLVDRPEPQLRAVAITRRPCAPRRVFSARYSSRNSPSAGTAPRSAS